MGKESLVLTDTDQQQPNKDHVSSLKGELGCLLLLGTATNHRLLNE